MRAPTCALLLAVASLSSAQSSVPELGGASDRAQGRHDAAHPAGQGDLHPYSVAAVQEAPQFPGGEQAMFRYLTKNIKYPTEAMEAGIQGSVFVEFVVGKDGRISEAKALRNEGTPLSQEAVRVVATMPNWLPGTLEGKAVPVRMVLPIRFTLRDDPPPAKEK